MAAASVVSKVSVYHRLPIYSANPSLIYLKYEQATEEFFYFNIMFSLRIEYLSGHFSSAALLPWLQQQQQQLRHQKTKLLLLLLFLVPFNFMPIHVVRFVYTWHYSLYTQGTQRKNSSSIIMWGAEVINLIFSTSFESKSIPHKIQHKHSTTKQQHCSSGNADDPIYRLGFRVSCVCVCAQNKMWCQLCLIAHYYYYFVVIGSKHNVLLLFGAQCTSK